MFLYVLFLLSLRYSSSVLCTEQGQRYVFTLTLITGVPTNIHRELSGVAGDVTRLCIHVTTMCAQ